MEPVQVGSKLKCSDIAAETLETRPGMNDTNTQMQIRSIISAPVLHPTIAPPPVSAFSNGDLGAKLITIVDLQNEMTDLSTNLVKVNGGSIDQFMLPKGILDQVDNDGKIILLTRKRDYLKTLLEKMPKKLQEAQSRSEDTIPQQTLQFHSNRDDTIPQKSRSDDTIIEGSNIPPLDVDHTLLDIPSGWVLPHRRAHEDKRNITVQYVFTWAVRLCATLKHAFNIHQIGLKFQASHGYDRKSWFRKSGKGHDFLHVEDIWKAACVSPLRHKPNKVRTPAAAAQTLQLDGSEERQENRGNKVRTPDGQEEPALKKQRTRRQNVKSDALKIVTELLQSSAKSADAGIKPKYIEIENMARSAVKVHFQPNPPEFSNVVNVTNMTKIWHWLLDGKLQNVNSEDLHNQAKEVHRPEDCGRATYSRPRSLAAAGPPVSGQWPAHSPPAAANDGPDPEFV